MNGSTYSTERAAADADEYAIACAILADDPDDADAAETIAVLDRKYGPGFFTD
jgi:hypothetical protein